MNSHSKTYTQKTVNAGTGVFAAIDIPPGELTIHVARPLVSALDSPHLKDTCYNCYLWVPEGQIDEEGEDGGTGDVRLKACTGCRVAKYCGKVGLVIRYYPPYSFESFIITSVTSFRYFHHNLSLHNTFLDKRELRCSVMASCVADTLFHQVANLTTLPLNEVSTRQLYLVISILTSSFC